MANLDSACGGAPHREGIGGAPPRLLCGAASLSAVADGGPRAGSGPAFAHARATLEAEATAGSEAVVVTSVWDLQRRQQGVSRLEAEREDRIAFRKGPR